MTFFEKLLTTFFINVHITPDRLSDTAHYTLVQLIAFNTASEFDDIIAELKAVILDLDNDIGNIDQGTNIQKNKTRTNDQVVALFSKTMSEKADVIADKLGGRNSEGYLEFYPNPVSDYTSPSKTKMPMLTKRVHDVAVTYATPLGTDLASLLQSFENMWTTSRQVQEEQMGKVDESREGRTPAMIAVNNKMKKALGILWTKYDGDDDKTAVYFDFNKLFNVTHHKHEMFTGSLAPLTKKTLSNEAFGDTQLLKGRNTSTNASFIIYIVAHPDDNPTLHHEVKPGKTFSVEASTLGDLAGTFLIIKNLSDVNETNYLVEVIE